MDSDISPPSRAAKLALDLTIALGVAPCTVALALLLFAR